MRKVLVVIVLSVLLPFGLISANAQTSRPENEFALTYGTATLPDFAMTFGAVLGTGLTGGYWKMENTVCTGGISLSYYRYLNNNIALGGTACYDCYVADAMTKHDGEYVYDGKFGSHFISVMPAAKFDWFYRDRFAMYSKLSAGVMFQISPEEGKIDSNDLSFSFAAQLSPVGVEAGGEKVRGFMEIGWGMQGLVLAGIKYAF